MYMYTYIYIYIYIHNTYMVAMEYQHHNENSKCYMLHIFCPIMWGHSATF